MTTVEDKLKLFAKIIFEKVEKDSEQKVIEFTKTHDQILEQEKQNILKESENMIKQARKKAESKKSQIISKANIDSQHALLKKRKELFDTTLDNLRKMALEYAKRAEYINFLEKCVKNGLSQITANEVVILFKSQDIKSFNESIDKMVNKYKKPDMKVIIEEANKDILGGCVCEDKGRTMRVDCSMASMIEENKALVGKMLMDNLQ